MPIKLKDAAQQKRLEEIYSDPSYDPRAQLALLELMAEEAADAGDRTTVIHAVNVGARLRTTLETIALQRGQLLTHQAAQRLCEGIISINSEEIQRAQPNLDDLRALLLEHLDNKTAADIVANFGATLQPWQITLEKIGARISAELGNTKNTTEEIARITKQ